METTMVEYKVTFTGEPSELQAFSNRIDSVLEVCKSGLATGSFENPQGLVEELNQLRSDILKFVLENRAEGDLEILKKYTTSITNLSIMIQLETNQYL